MIGWLALGGYGIYVWPVYGAAIVILGGLTISAVLRHRAAQRGLDAAERRR